MAQDQKENNVLINLKKHKRPGVEKILLYVKDPLESKYQLLIKWKEKIESKKLENPKVFIVYSQTFDDILVG